jgi:hypothetical protein
VLYTSNLTSPCGFDTFFITMTYSCTWKCFTCFFDNLDSHILLLSTRFLIKMYLLGATCIARTMRPYMGYPLTMGLRVCHPAGWVVDRRSGLSRRQRISLIVDFNGHFFVFLVSFCLCIWKRRGNYIVLTYGVADITWWGGYCWWWNVASVLLLEMTGTIKTLSDAQIRMGVKWRLRVKDLREDELASLLMVFRILV